MITARRRFLDAGFFAPLREALIDMVVGASALDVGCGDGYYSVPLGERSAHTWVGGVDISKAAIRLAARRSRALHYAVANAFDLPVVTDSIDVVLNVFGPIAPAEMARVVRIGGRILAVVPGPTHLMEMKRILFASADEHPFRSPLESSEHFGPGQAVRLTYPMDLDHELLEELVTMTPYRWKLAPDRLARLPNELRVTADFVVWRHHRVSSGRATS